jgi:hypothetical protein
LGFWTVVSNVMAMQGMAAGCWAGRRPFRVSRPDAAMP